MGTRFTLATWNVYQGLHYSSKRGPWAPNPAIDEHIAGLDADVLVLPELWTFRNQASTWAPRLAARLGYQLHEWIADAPSRPRDVVPWRMCILTRIPATRLPDQMYPKFSAFGQRAAVRVRLDDFDVTVAGVHLYGFHLMIRSPRQWLIERQHLRQTTAANDIVAGDFNIWGPVVARDSGALRPAVRGRTYTSYRPHSQIDHVLVADRIDVHQAEVLPQHGSDHLGLRVELALRR